jgi:hypothetical protein
MFAVWCGRQQSLGMGPVLMLLHVSGSLLYAEVFSRSRCAAPKMLVVFLSSGVMTDTEMAKRGRSQGTYSERGGTVNKRIIMWPILVRAWLFAFLCCTTNIQGISLPTCPIWLTALASQGILLTQTRSGVRILEMSKMPSGTSWLPTLQMYLFSHFLLRVLS